GRRGPIRGQAPTPQDTPRRPDGIRPPPLLDVPGEVHQPAPRRGRSRREGLPSPVGPDPLPARALTLTSSSPQLSSPTPLPSNRSLANSRVRASAVCGKVNSRW